MKKPQHFSHKAFCLSVAAKMFLEVALFLETYSVLKTRCTLDRPPWLADKGNLHTFSMISYFQNLLLKLIFHSHDT